MNKFRSAAIDILTNARTPLHYKEITRLALEKGILETDGATPEASMNASLSTDIIKKGEASDFIKTSTATFSINPNKSEMDPSRAKSILEEEVIEDENIKIDSGFIAKGGEYLVCSELLFREYNASIMGVDKGIDIIATKDNKLFSIQVKTANANSFKTYNFDVRKVSFKREYAGNTFYIFVMKDKTHVNYLILPLSEMEKKVTQKALHDVKSNEKYRVKIDAREDKIYLGNREHEMSYYLNNWNIIK